MSNEINGADSLNRCLGQECVLAGLLRASIEGQKPGCCRRNGTLWDIIAVYPRRMQWNEAMPAPVFVAGPVVRSAPDWDAKVLQMAIGVM